MNVSMENYQTLISRDVTYEKKTNKKGTPDNFGTSKLLPGPDSVQKNHIPIHQFLDLFWNYIIYIIYGYSTYPPLTEIWP